jgi:hypothetical protein
MESMMGAGVQALMKVMEQMNGEKGLGNQGGGQGAQGAQGGGGGGGGQEGMDLSKILEQALGGQGGKVNHIAENDSSKIETNPA